MARGKSASSILDPSKKFDDAQLPVRKRLSFHFLPVHASWLSFVEVWFSILSRKCLRHADFADASIATQQIEASITTYNTHLAHPFE